MITSQIGRIFLNAYNEKYAKEHDAKTFFSEVFYPLFFNHQKYMMTAGNSPLENPKLSWDDMIRGKKPFETDYESESLIYCLKTTTASGENAYVAVSAELSPIDSTVETIKNQLLEIAIKDAAKKAELLTRASGVKLCEILDIDYSWINVTLESDDMKFCKPMAFEDCCESQAYDVDFEPDDICASDSVRITFRIE